MTYSSATSVSRQRYASQSKNAVSFRATERTLGPISNTILLIVLACLLGLLYLTQATKTNAYGYTIEKLRTEQSALEVENDNLEVASARLQSLDRVQNSAAARSLVSVAPKSVVR